MKKTTLALSLMMMVCGSTNAHSKILKVQGKGLADIVADGWQVLDSALGDINNDGIDDLVFVIQDTDATKIEGKDWRKVDKNPRILALYNGTKTGYQQQQLVTDFIPTKSTPNLMEPFNDNVKGIEITKNDVIKIAFSYFMSAGGWGMSNEYYKLKLIDGEYQLIGYDNHSVQRNTMEVSDLSANFLTRKLIKSHYYDGKPLDIEVADSEEALYRDHVEAFELDERFTLNNINEFKSYAVRELIFDNRNYPKAQGANVAAVIAKNWNILSKVTGDLNHDGIQDVALKIQDTDPELINKKHGYDNNQQLIVIYFGSSDGLIRQGVYSENGLTRYELSIADNGVLNFSTYKTTNSKDSLIKATKVYKFQLRDPTSERLPNAPANKQSPHNNQQFLLIGYDGLNTIQKAGRKTDENISVNFLTRKAIYNNNGNIDAFDFRLAQLPSLYSEIPYDFREPIKTLNPWRIK